ncbi:DUF4293 domain-containing protein [Mucilaginibacter sp.]
MLQRVQSIYLFVAGLLIGGLYLFPILNTVYTGIIPVNVGVTGIYQNAAGAQIHTRTFLALTIVTAIIAILPILIVFLYKNRKQQIALCYSALLVIIGYSFWVGETIHEVVPANAIRTVNYGIGMFLVPISIVLVILAIRAIKSDEKLVRSADRLR